MDFDPLQLISPIASIVGGGLAGGVVSLYVNRRYYLRSRRTELYPFVEDMVKAYEIRSLLPEGKGWIVEGKKYRPGPSDDEFKAKRREFIDKLVRFNELEEARELRRTMLGSALDPQSQGFPPDVLGKESKTLGVCYKALKKQLGLD